MLLLMLLLMYRRGQRVFLLLVSHDDDDSRLREYASLDNSTHTHNNAPPHAIHTPHINTALFCPGGRGTG